MWRLIRQKRRGLFTAALIAFTATIVWLTSMSLKLPPVGRHMRFGLDSSNPFIVSMGPQTLVSNGSMVGIIPLNLKIDTPRIQLLPISPLMMWNSTFFDAHRLALSTSDGRSLEVRSADNLVKILSTPIKYNGAIQGAIYDGSRNRYVTIGTATQPVYSVIDEQIGGGSLDILDDRGDKLQSSFNFRFEPWLLSADSFADNIAVGTEEGVVHCFRSSSRGVDLITRLNLKNRTLTSLAVSPMGKFIAAGGSSGGRLWRVSDFKLIYAYEQDLGPESVDGFGGGWTFLSEYDGHKFGKAVFINEGQVRVFSLSQEATILDEFEVPLNTVKAIYPAFGIDGVYVVGSHFIDSTGQSGETGVYLIRLDKKDLTLLHWDVTVR